MATSRKKPTFEQQLNEVENIIAMMENGGLTLDESINRYEEGMKLLSEMEKQLTNATQRLTVIREKAAGEIKEETLEVSE